MKYVILIIIFWGVYFGAEFNFLPALSIVVWFYFVFELLTKSNSNIKIREFVMLLYGLNFLISPALIYHYKLDVGIYSMKIQEDEYFRLALPAMLFLRMGMFKAELHSSLMKLDPLPNSFKYNEGLLLKWLILGVGVRLVLNFLPAEIAFFATILSNLRYVAAFGLFIFNKRKYRWYLLALLLLELYFAILGGLFHDFLIWTILGGLLYVYVIKPPLSKKIIAAVSIVAVVFLIQVTKEAYRKIAWYSEGQESSIGLYKDLIVQNIQNSESFFTDENLSTALSRVNQGWILASTVDNMKTTNDFQNTNMIVLYFESALFPRVLLPNKLKSSDRQIFNRFSGHEIKEGTSMALGVLSDGYVAYKELGVYLFAFGLGLIFSLIFHIVNKWSFESNIFILFVFPIMFYPIRPDTDTQTILGYMVKSILVYAVLVIFYRGKVPVNTTPADN